MYIKKDFSYLIGIEGFSEGILKNHFLLYEGYVNNTNKLIEILDNKEPGSLEYSELQRRFAWEWNGMRFHELYFSNIKSGSGNISDGILKQKIEKKYGNVDNWLKNFIAVGLMRGIGWAVLAYDKESDELFNIWVNEHDVGNFVGAIPLLVIDVFEHAYMMDYGTKRVDYINMFLKNINWQEVEKRFENIN